MELFPESSTKCDVKGRYALIRDMALSALERLNASGKLIGVISHIDSLKERIPVQIKVSSEAGAGVSRLEDCYKVAQS